MPELPEVETLVRGLRPRIVGRTIGDVRLGKTDFMDNPLEITEHLPGCAIESVTRHGKFFSLALAKPSAAPHRLFVHLGMTGHFATHDPAEPVLKHTHLFATLDDGRELRFVDPRRFGRIALFVEEAFQALLAGNGTEPLDVSRDEFTRRVAGRAARIKALLLNQRVIGGIGNIYADESLWRAHLHPARVASTIDRARLEKLRRAIQKILGAAIALGGSSISNYRDAEGRPGSFQLRHRAYDREGQPCFRCRARIRRTVVAGRSSYFCPRCQPAPRKRKSKLEKRKPSR